MPANRATVEYVAIHDLDAGLDLLDDFYAGAVRNGRRGIGIELKPSYYRQAVRNVAEALSERKAEQSGFEFQEPEPQEVFGD